MWGTYDLGKPRTRILLRGLREAGADLVECHTEIWSGVEDKAQLAGWQQIAGRALKLLAAYPALIFRYLRAPAHDVVIVGYLGHLDVLVLWPFARLRGVPVLWDAFLSLYETVVEDRAMVGPRSLLARLLWAWDWLACRAAQMVLLDTKAHARWFESAFGLRPQRTAALFVGAEPDAFAAVSDAGAPAAGEPVRILFYGQFIPLHGIETIIRAAALTQPTDYVWTIIGTGQEASRIKRILDARPLPNVEWIPWVPYLELRQRIAAAHICLGIFGQSGKAGRVIPNKAFQVIAAGRPLVTRDSPAMRELTDGSAGTIALVAPGDPAALVAGIEALTRRLREQPDTACMDAIRNRINPRAIGQELNGLLLSMSQGAARS